jgi:acyl-CoA thioester hydrolase
VEWCKAAGFNYRDMEREDGCLLMVAEAQCRYKAPARFDDEIIIRTSILRARKRMITFVYELVNAGSGEVVATGQTSHLVTGPDLRPRSLPAKYWPVFGLT